MARAAIFLVKVFATAGNRLWKTMFATADSKPLFIMEFSAIASIKCRAQREVPNSTEGCRLMPPISR
jgi:hypothetical protein